MFLKLCYIYGKRKERKDEIYSRNISDKRLIFKSKENLNRTYWKPRKNYKNEILMPPF